MLIRDIIEQWLLAHGWDMGEYAEGDDRANIVYREYSTDIDLVEIALSLYDERVVINLYLRSRARKLPKTYPYALVIEYLDPNLLPTLEHLTKDLSLSQLLEIPCRIDFVVDTGE